MESTILDSNDFHSINYSYNMLYTYHIMWTQLLVLKEDMRFRDGGLESHGGTGLSGHYGANGSIILRETGKSRIIKISIKCRKMHLTFFFYLF